MNECGSFVDLGGSWVQVTGADRRTVAEMASRIYCELIVYHPEPYAREQSIAVAADLFARAKAALGRAA